MFVNCIHFKAMSKKGNSTVITTKQQVDRCVKTFLSH